MHEARKLGGLKAMKLACLIASRPFGITALKLSSLPAL